MGQLPRTAERISICHTVFLAEKNKCRCRECHIVCDRTFSWQASQAPTVNKA